ncbi:hypothetical protein AWZ03_013892 [Drosophila navojoa]|uniref:Protein TsetseEP domain-containing protein n=1 Tax=Drosophila navojoa TaxID=7232 RepID=A0A484AVU3_DRONA|nr:uncharacterized protein LOC115565023 [Drosophila navojoa]TDG39685.1 hypothetical protein AWZ03_013892 [Drosophila navojoa]
MKFVISSVVCLWLCLASVGHAQPASMPAALDGQLQTIVDEMTQIGENAAKALIHQYEEIVVEPHEQLDQAVEQVESRRVESPECVAEQDAQIGSVLDAAHQELHECGLSAAHESAEIVSDVNEATQQLVFGGYSLGRTYNKCQGYKNAVLRQSCMAKFYVQATVYLVSARSSLKTIAQSTNERIPAVFTHSNSCTHSASGKAVEALEALTADIDICIAKAGRR